MSQGKRNYQSRNKYLEKLGALNGMQYAWCWVNRKDRFVVFGLFDDHCNEEGQLILSDNWRLNKEGRVVGQYTNAVRHIKYIVNDGYTLKVLPQVKDREFEEQNDRAKVKYFYEMLHDAELRIVNGEYFADTEYAVHGMSAAKSSLNALDLYFAELLFPILVELAEKKQTATYQKLVKEVQRRHPSSEAAKNLIEVNVGSRLGAIWTFIQEHNCPHIGALIVNKGTRKVGSGFPETLNPELEQLKCFEYDWAPVLALFPSFMSGERTLHAIGTKKQPRRKAQEARDVFSKYYLEQQTEFEDAFDRNDLLKLKIKFEEKVAEGLHPGEAFAEVMLHAIDRGTVKKPYEGPEYVYLGYYVDADSGEPLFDYLKIGSSRDPDQRAKSLAGNVISPLEFEMLRTWEVQNGRALLIEKWLQGHFADIHYRGEFFHANEKGLLPAVSSIIRSRWNHYIQQRT